MFADVASPLVAVAALGGVFLVGATGFWLWLPPVGSEKKTSEAGIAASD